MHFPSPLRSNDAIPDSDSSEDYDREIDFSEPLQGNFVPFQPTISNSVAPPLPAYSSTPPPLPMVTDRQSGSFSPALPPSYQQHQIERPASGSYNPGLPPALPSYSTPPPLPSVTDRPQSGSYSNSSIPPPLPQLTYLPPPPTDQSHPTFQTNSILPPPPNFSTSSNIPAGFQTPPLPQYNRPPSGPQTPPTLPGQDYHSNRPPSGPIPPPLPQHDSRPSSGAYAPPLPLYNNSRPLSGSHGDPPPPPSIYSQAPVTPNQAPAIPVTVCCCSQILFDRNVVVLAT